MRNPGGQATWTEPDGSSASLDTFTCSHCNAIVIVRPSVPLEDLGGFCRLCMKNVCGPCADKGVCRPFLKRIEREEEAEYRRRQNAKILGL